MAFTVVALHKRQDLVDACVSLLNSEWSRSQSARLHSLEKSCDGLPYSLVMIETCSGQEKVSGYCRLAKVVNKPKAVFIESVVVPIVRRGQGLGRRLMELAEGHAVQHGYTQIYLTTKDKQGFYEHLGYQYCKPVNTLNAQVLETCSCQLLTNITASADASSKTNSTCGTECTDKEEQSEPDPDPTKPNAASQLPQSNSTVPDAVFTNQETCCTVKESCSTNSQEPSQQGCIPAPSGPPPPPPPAPPPPPPVIVPAVTVYWMMKDL